MPFAQGIKNAINGLSRGSVRALPSGNPPDRQRPAQQRPFHRFESYMREVNKAHQQCAGNEALLRQVLNNLPAYESRGHGRGRRSPSRNTTAQVKRASIKAKHRAKHRASL